jgi:hypothetical protein
MKAQLRNHVAALMLLAPAAALVGAPSAALAADARAEIQALQVNADHGVSPGSVLRFELRALPGSQASVALGGSDVVVPLREVSSGLYRGTYTVRGGDRLDPRAVITARLAGPRTATHDFSYPASFLQLAQAGAPEAPRRLERERDRQPPTIVDTVPRAGQRIPDGGRTNVTGRFEDAGGGGIDPESVRITLDGRDVTDDARITPHEFTYRADLSPGEHVAEVAAKDKAGNAVTRRWNFIVGAAGPLALQVSAPSPNAAVDANGNLRIHGRTAPMASVTVRVQAVPPAERGRTGVAQQVAVDTVQADRDGNFTLEVAPRGFLPAGTRYDVSLTAHHGQQTAEQRLTLYQRPV